MHDVIDLVVVQEDEGYGAFSPQLPGFVYGRPTLTEFKRDLTGALKFAGGAKHVRMHFEKHTWDEQEREFAVRWADDDLRADRVEVAQRIYAAMTVPQHHEDLLSSTKDRAGAVVFVCAVPGDKLGLFAALLDESSDAIVITVAIAEQMIWTSQMGSTGGHPDWVSLESMGASLETTVGEWMTILNEQGADRKVLVSV